MRVMMKYIIIDGDDYDQDDYDSFHTIDENDENYNNQYDHDKCQIISVNIIEVMIKSDRFHENNDKNDVFYDDHYDK